MMMFVCVVAIGTFVMAPAELGEPARICVALHWGADLAQREGGGGDRFWLERQQLQHERQERIIQREWRKQKHWWFPPSRQKTQSIDHKPLEFYRKKGCCCIFDWKKNNSIHKTIPLHSFYTTQLCPNMFSTSELKIKVLFSCTETLFLHQASARKKVL